MFDLSGQVALVTGASRGIGEAAARSLAKYGAKVLLAARSGTDIERIAGEIRAEGRDATAVVCDVADYDEVVKAVQTAIDTYGGLDILVNNAGVIEPISRIEDSDPAEWGKVIDINVKGVYYGLRAVAPHMLAKGAGTVVNISSGAAVSALEGWSHYCASRRLRFPSPAVRTRNSVTRACVSSASARARSQRRCRSISRPPD